MNSKNNLEMNNKIEICNEGKKAYDIVLNGNEIGGGSVRWNSLKLRRKKSAL